MLQKMFNSTLIFITSSLLYSCSSTPSDVADNTSQVTTRQSNKGALCLFMKSDTEMQLFHYPLGSSCASSSLNRWADHKISTAYHPTSTSFDVIYINTSATHILRKSTVSTADCAGSGSKLVNTKVHASRSIEVIWGEKKLGFIASGRGAIRCNRIAKDGRILPARDLFKQVPGYGSYQR